jgi:hypothetical protein
MSLILAKDKNSQDSCADDAVRNIQLPAKRSFGRWGLGAARQLRILYAAGKCIKFIR